MRFPRRNKIDYKCHLDKNRRYRKIIDFKPTCYWYGIGNEWYKFWYEYAEIEKVKDQVVCQIDVKRNSLTTFEKKERGKILVIDSLDEVKKLNKKYSVLSGPSKEKYRLIDFNKLSETYGGIEFRNYSKIKKQINENKKLHWRRDYVWYFMLDVSSGCVWDLDLINVKEVGKLKFFIL
jgi:hypothetical protein